MARNLTTEETPSLTAGRSSLFAGLAIGVFVGLFGWALMLAINGWILDPVFCRSADTASTCANADLTAWIIAHVVVSIIGLFMLIRANVFRPLLVTLAALATLWAVGLWFVSSDLWVGFLWETVLFALAYALFTWIASAKRFFYAVIVITILVILFRVLISL